MRTWWWILAGACAFAAGGCSAPLPPIGAPTVVAQAGYGDATLGLEAPDDSGDPTTRPGPRAAPSSFAVVESGAALAVIDSVHARLLRLPTDGSAPSPLDVDPFYGEAPDVAATSDGALWALGPGDCGCVRRLDGAGAMGLALAVPPELDPGLLVPDGARLLIAAPDGARVLFDGAALDLESVRDRAQAGPHAGALTVAAALDRSDPRSITALFADDGGQLSAQGKTDALGDAGRLELVAPACGGGALVVANVVAADGSSADTMLRFDAHGAVVARAQAPRLASELGNFEIFRRFAATPDGKLFQLRIAEEGYAILSWPTGC